MLKVSRQPSGKPEIFQSIQGEGVTVGTPTVFLRLAICNLSCLWCDTKYSWDWNQYNPDKEIMEMPVEEVAQCITSYDHHHLVITGGEPMLQQKHLAPLASMLSKQGYYCEIETNGTIMPTKTMVDSIAQWNVSPKTSNSGNSAEKREVKSVLTTFSKLDNAYFKFVVTQPADIETVDKLVTKYNLPSCRVILMPEGTTAKTVTTRGKWLAEASVKHGFLFSTRLHVTLWGAERGK